MFSDGRDPAHTCACCGQALRSTGTLTLQVESLVLDLCNQAFADAEAAGHAHVDVAHLICVLTRSPQAEAIFWQMNLDAAGMAAASHRWLARMDRRRDALPLTASAELKALLTRAEARALRDGRSHAGLVDVIGLVAELTASGPDAGAPEIPRSVGAAPAPSRRAPPIDGLLTTTPPHAGASAHATGGFGAATAATGAFDQAALTALLARLDRLETELAALRAAKGDSASARARTSQSATSRTRTRGQSYDPGVHVLSTQSTAERIYMRRMMRRRREEARRRRTRQSERHAAAGRERLGETTSRSGSWAQTRPTGNAGLPRERTGQRLDFEREGDAATGEGAKRFFLALDDHIERAPSIGPKTAGRLVDCGIATVRDLLAADPEALAGAGRAKFITPQRLRDWQAQARLVCTVPFLRGTHAQLLVGAGYADLGRLAAADPSILCAAVLKFAATRDGQSVLRAATPPDMERIARWLQNAAEAEPARAAA